jgi:hypothetical protein
MGVSRCRVSYTDAEGVHSVEVTAETLFEAIAQAVAEFEGDKTVPSAPGPETEFRVQVLRKPVEHFIKLKRVVEWAQFGNTTGPGEMLRRERVRKMLQGANRGCAG